MIEYKSQLPHIDLADKKIFLRADLNVPIQNGIVFDDFKLNAILPTIRFLVEHKAKIIIATHLGRPKAHDINLSTKNFLNWFDKNNLKVIYIDSLEKDIIDTAFINTNIVLLENLRFYPREKTGDLEFAQMLKNLAEIYIFEAFGSIHRSDTSISVLPNLFDFKNRTIGFLVEKELKNIFYFKEFNGHPYTLILGGGKVKDKLTYAAKLIAEADRSGIDNLILCPALVFTYLNSLGYNVGNSKIEPELKDLCGEIREKIEKTKTKLLLPEDFLVFDDGKKDKQKFININDFKSKDVGVSIGSKSLEKFKRVVLESQKIFFNCGMGFEEIPSTLEPLHQLLKYVSSSNGFKMVGGGSSVSAVYKFGLESKINYCSTGGGAILDILSGSDLPVLHFFRHE